MDSDCLLKIDGIDGESSQKDHEKWIEMLSWKWGQANTGSSGVGSGAGSGKVAMRDFVFTMNYGISSPKLLLACATGMHIPSCTLHLRKAGGDQHVYMLWKFTDVLISGYRATMGAARRPQSSSGGQIETHALPVETISFNFAQIELEYRPQAKSGTLNAGLKAGFDIKTGCKL